jgi:hypothetical protein
MFLEVEGALPSDIKKHADSSDPFLFPKLEDCPMSTFPSISVPFKLEPDSQELDSTSITDQGKYFRVEHYSQNSVISIL